MIYRFGDCEVDTKLLELRRGGESQPVDPLAFDLLRYLIENRDRVLTRDELLDNLWPGKVVTDSALSSRVKSVRSAVGDTGASQRIVKTIHGRGYRFVADLADRASPPATQPAPAGIDPSVARTMAVGRDRELGKLARWLDRARAGRREIVLVSGDAGVGKTTLTRAFLNTARDQAGTFVLTGQCVNQRGASEAYLPLLEALGRAGGDDREVAELIHRYAPAWLAQLPALGRVDRGEQPPEVFTAGRMLRELSDLLNQLAQRRDTILVLEDLHWSDPSTVGWIEYYARRGDSARLLLIATLRPDGPFQAECLELAVRGHAHHLMLDSIDEADVSAYLNQRLSHPPSPELAALTYHRTSGFPLFIDTLIDHWLDRGLVRRIDGTWSAASDEEALLAGVPESLSQLIDQQLVNLRPGERDLLQTAALAGSPFPSAAIAYALGEPEEVIEALCEHLARQGRIVRHSGDARWPDGTVSATFEFRHELYREALYQCVASARRARLHRALGERLEQAYGDDPGPVAGQLADHFARGNEGARALKYFYPAALSAFNRSAYRETVSIVNRALALIRNLTGLPDSRRVERDLLLLRASALIFLEGWSSSEVEESYLRARTLGAELGLTDNLPEVYGLAALHENRGQYKKSQATIESLLDESSDVGLEGHELLACSLFHQGRFERSKQNADRAIEAFDPTDVSAILARYGENPGVSCHSWAALDLWFMGQPDTAVERSDLALELADVHPYSRCSALTMRSFLHQFRNEPDETMRWCESTRELGETEGYYYRVAQVMILAAWARARLSEEPDHLKEALEWADESLRRHADIGSEMNLPYHLTLRAEILASMGEDAEALAVQQQAFDSNPPGREFFYEAEMHRQLALLSLKVDPTAIDQAEQALERSLAVARRHGARMLELRTCVTRCEFANGKDLDRRRELERLLASLPEGQDTPDWRAASACIEAGATQPKKNRRG